MHQYVIKNNKDGKFFVLGAGFTATEAKDATRFDDNDTLFNIEVGLGAGGFDFEAVDAPQVSFSVVYIRKGEGKRLLAGQGKAKADGNKGQVDPSKRRFATIEEAIVHGSRFYTRRAKAGDEQGTAGHEGFFVVETNDPVNATINPLTQLTNTIES
jgi:hypothetical protein